MPGEESYPQYAKEKAAILKSLAERAKLVADTFNSIPRVSCNTVQGAMYAFPQVRFFFLSCNETFKFSFKRSLLFDY